MVETVARTYREAMREFAKLRNLEIWYARLDVEQRVAVAPDRRAGK